MRQGWSAVVLQRAKYWIGVDLVSGAIEEACAIVVTEIVPVGDNRATVVVHVRAHVASVYDGVFHLECSQAVYNCASGHAAIAAQGAVTDRALSAVKNAAAV